MKAQILPVILALFPVFLIILTGYFLKAKGLLKEADQNGIEKVTYHVFFPAVVIMSLVKVNLGDLPFWSITFSLAGTVLLMMPLLFLLKRFAPMSGADFTSLIQGTIRWNSFVGIALCGALYGTRGLAISAIAVLALIPLVNVICVIALSVYGTGERLTVQKTALTLIKNPFIWSSIVGLFLSLTKFPLPQVLLNYGDILGQAALAVGLIMVGAGLNLNGLKQISIVNGYSLALKLLISPAICYLLAINLGVAGADLKAMMICAAVPTASASYILARQLGGNAPLMAEIITIQTLVAIITLPLWLIL